jgi:hypothetical protein
MKRKTVWLGICLLFLCPVLLIGQDRSGQPSPVPPADVLGPQLIAWSQLQKPEPVQQVEATKSEQSADPQPENPRANQPGSPGVQTLTGTILKDAGRYILKIANTKYQLDDQDVAKPYEGRRVNVTGAPDANGHSFHVVRIELIS